MTQRSVPTSQIQYRALLSKTLDQFLYGSQQISMRATGGGALIGVLNFSYGSLLARHLLQSFNSERSCQVVAEISYFGSIGKPCGTRPRKASQGW